MKRHLAAFLVTLLLAGCGSDAGPIRAQAADAQPGIETMLAEIPVSAFEDGWLSYADTSVLIANTPGAIEPGSVEEYERLAGTPEGSATFHAYMGIYAGPGDFYMRLNRMRDMLMNSGLDFFQVRRMIEAGVAPRRQMWLSGTFDSERIRDILLGRGYLLIPDTKSKLEIWCRDGDIASGLRFDLSRRDPSFPFGGNLGQSWPVMLSDTLIGSSPDAHAVQAVASAAEPSLMSLSVLSDLVSAVAPVDEKSGKSLAQLYLLTPSAAGLDLPGLTEGLARISPSDAYASDSGADQRPLPAYSALALAQVFTDGAQWVVVGLSFADEANAAEAEQVINSRLQKAVLHRTGDLLADRLLAMNGRMEPLRTTVGKGGSHVLIIPFRFPAQTAAENSGELAALPGQPFRFFTSLLMSRDLGWLTIGLPE